jgi:hypothetical protein
MILILILFFEPNKKEDFENIKIDIGNTFCDYYYKYFISIINKKNFVYNVKSTYNGKYIEEKSQFIDSLPKKILFNAEIYDKLIETNIDFEKYKNVYSLDFWGIHSLEKHTIHAVMKPYMNKIFNNLFTKLGLNVISTNPIIHFRCADTPFIKINNYHFQKYDFFKDVLKKYNYNKVIILSCTKHLSSNEERESCMKYAELLKDQLKIYNPEIKCGTNIDDFVSMFYAPVVISTQSSYSFMAGFFGNSTYIQPNFMENDKECEDCFNDWRGYSVPHEMITNYHDTEKVYNLLN